MSPDELRELPVVVDVPTAARILGVGRTVAYRLVQSGQWPTPVLRVGRLVRVPTAPLLALVGASAPGSP
jgi:excisionase family DNA binding protein